MNSWNQIGGPNQPDIGQDILICMESRTGIKSVKAIKFYGWGTLNGNITGWQPMPLPPADGDVIPFEQKLKAELRSRKMSLQESCEKLGLKYGTYKAAKGGALHKRPKEEIDIWAKYLNMAPADLVKGTDLELSYKGGKDARTIGYAGDLGKTITDGDIEILRDYADCDMSAAKVARKRFMHTNTVQYHLDKIRKISGHDPHRFWDLVKLLGVYGIKR